MGITAAIQTIWAATPALVAACPIDKVVTGRIDPDHANDHPYVIVSTPMEAGNQRTTDSNIDEVQILFEVWSDTYEQAESIAEAIKAAFRDTDFATDGGRILDMTLDSGKSNEEDQPTHHDWQFTVQFTAKYHTARVNI